MPVIMILACFRVFCLLTSISLFSPAAVARRYGDTIDGNVNYQLSLGAVKIGTEAVLPLVLVHSLEQQVDGRVVSTWTLPALFQCLIPLSDGMVKWRDPLGVSHVFRKLPRAGKSVDSAGAVIVCEKDGHFIVTKDKLRFSFDGWYLTQIEAPGRVQLWADTHGSRIDRLRTYRSETMHDVLTVACDEVARISELHIGQRVRFRFFYNSYGQLTGLTGGPSDSVIQLSYDKGRLTSVIGGREDSNFIWQETTELDRRRLLLRFPCYLREDSSFEYRRDRGRAGPEISVSLHGRPIEKLNILVSERRIESTRL